MLVQAGEFLEVQAEYSSQTSAWLVLVQAAIGRRKELLEVPAALRNFSWTFNSPQRNTKSGQHSRSPEPCFSQRLTLAATSFKPR